MRSTLFKFYFSIWINNLENGAKLSEKALSYTSFNLRGVSGFQVNR